jgi:signal transduction histidine kinase
MSAHADPTVEPAGWQRSLLPGGLVAGTDEPRTARDRAIDVLVFAGAFALGTVLLATVSHHYDDARWFLDAMLGLACLVALGWRRRHPAAVGVATTLASIVSAAAGGPALIALFSATVRASRDGLIAVWSVAVVSALVYPLVIPGEESYLLEASIGLLITVVIVGWGLFARARHQLVLSLRERAARLEAEQRLHVEQAREAERRRIAREMHDVLAHRVSLLTLHAGALEFRPDAPPEEIAEAAGVVRASAHAVLQELREVVGVLREGEEGTERPQPTLADIPGLVEESRAAGMRVESRIDADADVAAATGRTAYRIVQEGLTNARKHAPSAAVTVTVAARGSGSPPGLEVEVLTRRAVGAPGAAAPPPGTGTGLIGLAERVALAGGEFHHGPRAGGDHVLHAVLP